MLERFISHDGFRRIPLTGNRYSISIDGEICEHDGCVVKQTLDDNNNLVIWGNLYVGWGFYKVAVLSAITFKNIQIPFQLWNLLDIMFIDENKHNVHPSNLVWKFPVDGLKFPKNVDFAFIPGFSRYVINKLGELYYWPTNKKINFYNADGYYATRVQPDIGNPTTIGRHRLLALAWLEYPATVDKLDVNHLNGVRGYDEITNLEWATRSRNNQHAVELGLKTDNCEVQVRNVLTGKVQDFCSYTACGKAYGLSHCTIRLRVNDATQSIWPGYLQFKVKDDSIPWRHIDDPEKELRIKKHHRKPIELINSVTGDVIKYNSYRDAARFFNVDASSIAWQLKNTHKNIPYKGYFLRYQNNEHYH